MNLAALSPTSISDTGFPVVVLHPTTNLPMGITVTVCGSDSATFKKIQRRQLNSRMERQVRNRKNKSFVTAEELEAEGLDLLVGCTKAWHTGDRPELEMEVGEWLPCTPENVRRVYEELPWLKEQIDQEIGDRTNFLSR